MCKNIMAKESISAFTLTWAPVDEELVEKLCLNKFMQQCVDKHVNLCIIGKERGKIGGRLHLHMSGSLDGFYQSSSISRSIKRLLKCEKAKKPEWLWHGYKNKEEPSWKEQEFYPGKEFKVGSKDHVFLGYDDEDIIKGAKAFIFKDVRKECRTKPMDVFLAKMREHYRDMTSSDSAMRKAIIMTIVEDKIMPPKLGIKEQMHVAFAMEEGKITDHLGRIITKWLSKEVIREESWELPAY